MKLFISFLQLIMTSKCNFVFDRSVLRLFLNPLLNLVSFLAIFRGSLGVCNSDLYQNVKQCITQVNDIEIKPQGFRGLASTNNFRTR